MQQRIMQHRMKPKNTTSSKKNNSIFTRPVLWIAGALLLRLGLDLFAEIMLDRKGKRRRKDVS